MKKQDELMGIVINETRKLAIDLVRSKGIPLQVVLAGMHAQTSDSIMARSMVIRWQSWSHQKMKSQDDEMSALMNECCDKLDAALSGMSILSKAILAEGMGLPLTAMLDGESDQADSLPTGVKDGALASDRGSILPDRSC